MKQRLIMGESELDLVFYFVFMSLVLGAICREIKKLTSIPYTPMLIVVGIGWGLLEEWLGYTGRAADFIEKIEPVRAR